MEEKWSKALVNLETLIGTKADKSDLDKKADKDDLLSSWGERVMRISLIRWGIGAALLAFFTTAASQHWFTWMAKFIERHV